MIMGGSSSVAERQLPKLNVAGSIPVSRSNKVKKFHIDCEFTGSIVPIEHTSFQGHATFLEFLHLYI